MSELPWKILRAVWKLCLLGVLLMLTLSLSHCLKNSTNADTRRIYPIIHVVTIIMTCSAPSSAVLVTKVNQLFCPNLTYWQLVYWRIFFKWFVEKSQFFALYSVYPKTIYFLMGLPLVHKCSDLSFSLNRSLCLWADSVIELPCPSGCLSVRVSAPSGAVFF